MAGYTDLPFRRACRRWGCRRAFTPLIDAGALAYGNRHNALILARGADEPWLGVQLLGSEPELMARAAAVLADMPFEQLDLNMGCPVRKVMQKGAGAALPLVPGLARQCVEAVMRQNPRMPVTAKMRVLHEEDPEPTAAFARHLEQLGIQGLTIHGRTWERIYAGPVRMGIIREVRQAVSIPVVANGGVFCRDDGFALAAGTGCTGVMVARGAIGNPWIFRELAEPGTPPPTHDEICAEMHAHLQGMVALYGEEVAMRNGRKIILAYLCGRGYRRSLRAAVGGLSSWAQFEAFHAAIRADDHHDLAPGQGRHRLRDRVVFGDDHGA